MDALLCPMLLLCILLVSLVSSYCVCFYGDLNECAANMFLTMVLPHCLWSCIWGDFIFKQGCTTKASIDIALCLSFVWFEHSLSIAFQVYAIQSLCLCRWTFLVITLKAGCLYGSWMSSGMWSHLCFFGHSSSLELGGLLCSMFFKHSISIALGGIH